MNLLKSHKAHQKKCYGAFLKTLLFGMQRSKESSPGDRSHHPAKKSHHPAKKSHHPAKKSHHPAKKSHHPACPGDPEMTTLLSFRPKQGSLR
jgi:hypothetical protein